AWSNAFFDELKEALRAELSQKYWWLFFMKRFVFDPRFDRATEKYRPMVVDQLARLYLRAIPRYRAAEGRAVQQFFDQHVRLVYGGGARNNAELFLPSLQSVEGKLTSTWTRRPSFRQIMQYQGGENKGKNQPTLIEALKGIPGVSLIFVRKNNDEISAQMDLPDKMEILVLDRLENRGWIRIRRDQNTRQLVFGYGLDSETKSDPLGYLDSQHKGQGVWKTYQEWNDWCLENETYYHNAVAGMGAYLYSKNPSIGDLTVMHSQGWNFGANAGGHGGLHREEKLTVMLVSGPGIQSGSLMAVSKYKTVRRLQGPVSVVEERGETHPTLLDVAPTVLQWLGYGEEALSRFARNGFESHLTQWVSSQRSEIPAHFDDLGDLNQALKEAGVENFELSDFSERLRRLFEVLPEMPPPLPDYRYYREDGNLLVLSR
ncbi:hypothetical protein MYX84_14140, partial [Acidobacteria bacterium AH-259-O06]|nr:hypothetical protein [Acidobacteria bacterium AH-259-O06]